MPDEFARQLRRNQTEAEAFVWKKVRNRRLGGFKFRRQLPLGIYYGDFVCLEAKVVLELDGGQHDERREHDEMRTRWLEAEGFLVIRLWNCDAFTNWERFSDELWELLRARAETPSP